jgi:hypothetical protein
LVGFKAPTLKVEAFGLGFVAAAARANLATSSTGVGASVENHWWAKPLNFCIFVGPARYLERACALAQMADDASNEAAACSNLGTLLLRGGSFDDPKRARKLLEHAVALRHTQLQVGGRAWSSPWPLTQRPQPAPNAFTTVVRAQQRRPALYSDARVASRNGRGFGWEIAHAAVSRRPPRFPSPGWYPVLTCTTRRRSLGFVHRSRTLFCRPVPSLSVTVRNGCTVSHGCTVSATHELSLAPCHSPPHTIRSSTHGHLSAAKGSTTTISRSDIRLI